MFQRVHRHVGLVHSSVGGPLVFMKGIILENPVIGSSFGH